MVRKVFSLFILWMCVVASILGEKVQAQGEGRKLILRIVSAETGQAIPDVICSVWDSTHRRTAFAQTNHEGLVTFTIRPHDYSLSFALLGYKKRELLLASPELSVERATIRLESEEIKLREVHIKAPPITSHGDTLRYRVKAFAGAQDRYIEDVLKKLPGIQVSESGQISYQGKPINKFYIEGQDPLGLNYNQASRNLPAEAVEQVDVIEHNQHKRILQGKVFEEHAALNIRLNKKYLFRPFGEVMGGTGVKPPLWTGKVFLMQAAKGNQLITNLKGNNVGHDLATDFIEHVDPFEQDHYEPLPSTILRSSASVPPLSEHRYLKNRAFNWGLNDLQKLGAYGSLRLNALGYHDHTTNESSHSIHYQGATSFDLNEVSSLTAKPNYYRAALHYEHNAPKLFLLADLLYSSQAKTSNESLISNNQAYRLTLRQRPQWLQADLQSNIYWGRTLILVKSSTRGYTALEHLSGWQSTPMGQDDPFTAYRRVSQLVTTNSAKVGFPIGKVSLNTGLIAKVVLNRYGGERLLAPNDNSYGQLAVGVNTSLSYSVAGINFSLSSPLYYQVDRLWVGSAKDGQAYLHLAPSFSLRKRFSSYSDLNLSASYQESPDVDPYYSDESIRRGYRSYSQSLEHLYYRKALNVSTRFTYRNPIEMLFTYIWVRYRQTAHSYLRDVRIRPKATLSIPMDTVYMHRSYSVQGVLDKSFPEWALSLHTELGYTHARYLASLAEHVYPVRSDNLLSTLSLRWSKLSALSASYSIGLGSLWLHRPSTEARPILRLEQELKLTGSLGKSLSLTALLQHTMSEGSMQSYKHTLFCDLKADWIVSRRIKLEGSLTNIWNQQAYTLTTISATQLEHFSLPLRPREFLLSCFIRL